MHFHLLASIRHRLSAQASATQNVEMTAEIITASELPPFQVEDSERDLITHRYN